MPLRLCFRQTQVRFLVFDIRSCKFNLILVPLLIHLEPRSPNPILPYPQTSSFPSLTSLRITQLLNALSILFSNYIYLVQARRPRLQEGRYCQGRAQNGHVSTRTVHQNKPIIYKPRSHVLSSLAINLVYLVLPKNLVPRNRSYRS